MDRPWHDDQLGVNKIEKNIKKSPLHQPNFSNGIGIASARPQPQPQVYNIGKNDFRSIVQQLTSSPSRQSLPQNPLKPQQNTRLQKIRPAAQTQINRPLVPLPVLAQPTDRELVARPPMQPYMHHGSQPMMGHGDHFLSNTAESRVSVYMRNLQSSLGDSGPNETQMQPSHEYQPQPQVQGLAQPHPPSQSNNHHSPRLNGCAQDAPILPTPRFNSPPQQIYNNSIHTPRFNGRGILPTPTSQYLLQSPRSPYPLLSPGVRYPPPLTPRGSTFSPMGQPGILGPGIIRQPPASPGLVSPSSLYGVFPISSPGWRGY